MITIKNTHYSIDEAKRLLDAFDALNAELCEVTDRDCDQCEYKQLCIDVRAAETFMIEKLADGYFGNPRKPYKARTSRDC